METDADRFAAELLMPERAVRRVWERYKDNIEYRVSIVAVKFEVSKSAMGIRVRGLGLK
jgi:Zn-dependent peptidase ImmA (M78 family)